MQKFNVGILGATGAVGQKFIRLLENHPWFNVTTLGASKRSAGKIYTEAVQWIEPFTIPYEIAQKKVQPCKPVSFNNVDFVFSGLDSAVAESIEAEFAASGIPVISNAKNFRMHGQVPLLIPEVNPDHVDLIRYQKFTENGKGWIVTNPNCVVIPLAMSLKPLHECFGIESVLLTSMQAVSGGGYPGVPSLDILGNVIPHIGGEESKIHSEPLKLLGKVDGNTIQPADFPIQATATRVPVRNGHLLSITVGLKEKTDQTNEIIDAFKNWKNPLGELNLPSAPEYPLFIHENESYPQPQMHADEEQGMRTAIGRIRKSNVLDISFIAMAHNTIRGAAGGAILNAELLVRKDYLKKR